MIIEPIQKLELIELSDLIEESVQEGFNFIARLIDDWKRGINRFEKENEKLYQVIVDNEIVGIGGINNNPYQEQGNVGRIRHLYVHPDYRRNGIGRKIILNLIKDFRDKYEKITLRTEDKIASDFYESLGFNKINNSGISTHEKIMPDRLLGKIFETDRLLIREFIIEDFDYVHEYASNGEVVKYQAWGPNKEKDTLIFLQESRKQINNTPRLTHEWCIESKEDQKVIGGCGIFLLEDNLKEAKIGYIINPKYWNNGYATEATKGLIDYGLKKMKIELIRATTDKRNRASQRVLKRNGFEIEKLIERDYEQKGEMRDTYLFRLKT